MPDYKERLKGIRDTYRARANARITEEDTKRVFVIPFVQALGYDTNNLAEFRSEVSASNGRRVDYVVLHDGNPVIIIECKPTSNNRLMDERGQLQGYYNAVKPVVAVLTNGNQYQFFGDLDGDGDMDSAPYLEINLDDYDDEDFGNPGASDINALKHFTKSEFNADSIRDAATEMKYKQRMRNFLEQQFSGTELHKDLVELLARLVYTGRLGANIRANLGALALEVFREFKDELVKSAVGGSHHSTTSEEMEGYFIVKNILWNVVDGDRVIFKDSKTYSKVQMDHSERSRKRVCLFRFNDLNRKKLGLLDGDEEDQVDIASVGEINTYADRIRATAQHILEAEGQRS